MSIFPIGTTYPDSRKRHYLSTKVAIYYQSISISIYFLRTVGGSLNTLVLITAHRKSRYRAGGGDLARTNIHFLVFHLTLADTIVSMGEISIRAGNQPSRNTILNRRLNGVKNNQQAA